MPRLPRLHSIPFGWYYIALYAARGRTLVRNDEDLKMFLDLLHAKLQKERAHIHAGCVTPKEAHLAVQCGERPVSAITRNFCHEYARRFNRRHLESGRLFRTRPHVLLIQHRRWLVPLAHVIHWIPRRQHLQLCAGEKYWSSDAMYRGRARLGGLVTQVVLQLVSGGARRRAAQRDAYRKRFDRSPDEEQIRLLSYGSPSDSRVLGDEEFLADILSATGHASPRQNLAPPLAGDLRQVVADAVEKFGAMCDLALPRRKARAWTQVVTLEQLCSHSRKRPLPVISALITTHVIACGMATRSEAARFFGCRPDTLVAHRRRRAEVQFFEWFGATSDVLFPDTRGD